MKERSLLILKLVSSHLLMIPLLIGISFFINSDSFLLITICQSVILIVFQTGYWEFFGMQFRIICSIFFEFLLFADMAYKFSSNSVVTGNPYVITILGLIQAYLLYELVKIVIVIFRVDKKKYDIAFPFHNGKYLVTDGGNSKISRLMNYHYYSAVHKKNKTNNSMMYATDIVKIGSGGKRFLPPRNEDYKIFEEFVYSPVSGVVVKVENEINDNIPYCGGYPYNTGNTIVIKKDNLFMLLGHLKKGSIRVKVGDIVSQNEQLAEAGNSGFSERPHLHMQLIESNSESYWKGHGISIMFENKNLYKNRIIMIN